MLRLTLVIVICLIIRLTKTEEWKFPDDFKFGVATAAYQIEGGWNADGKGLNIWDVLTHNRSELVKDRSNGDIACDSYNRWEEDVENLKNLGVNSYRLSLSWTRILPNGYDSQINQAGIDYYNKLINKLIENGIEPMITIFHWDLPYMFSPLGGWTNPTIIKHYANYARIVFKNFGDRVKMWITFNEPRLICHAYKGLVGDVTPVYPLGTVEYMCAHNILKAHAEAYHIYDREFRKEQKGKISITIDFTWHEPADTNNPDDVRAAEQRRQFDVGTKFGIYANPIFNYDYPKEVIDRVAERSRLEGFSESRLPKFTLAEKMRIKGTYDYLGINHYITFYTKASNDSPNATAPNTEIDGGGIQFRDPDWQPTGADWIFIVPWGLRHLLQYVKKTYRNPDVYITESGCADINDTLEDTIRTTYYKEYLNATLQAIHEDGVKVRGYSAWSLMDNFEWIRGYTLRFGLYHVDFNSPNRTRTAKSSVEYFKRVIKTRSIN